jgi:hypothetical protein
MQRRLRHCVRWSLQLRTSFLRKPSHVDIGHAETTGIQLVRNHWSSSVLVLLIRTVGEVQDDICVPKVDGPFRMVMTILRILSECLGKHTILSCFMNIIEVIYHHQNTCPNTLLSIRNVSVKKQNDHCRGTSHISLISLLLWYSKRVMKCHSHRDIQNIQTHVTWLLSNAPANDF